MAEINKLLPMPPQLGPPLPGVLRAYWPWLKQPPRREYVLPIFEEPELIIEPQEPEPEAAPQTQPAPVPAHSSIAYDVESPPEIPSAEPPSGILLD